LIDLLTAACCRLHPEVLNHCAKAGATKIQIAHCSGSINKKNKEEEQ